MPLKTDLEKKAICWGVNHLYAKTPKWAVKLIGLLGLFIPAFLSWVHDNPGMFSQAQSATIVSAAAVLMLVCNAFGEKDKDTVIDTAKPIGPTEDGGTL